MFNRHARADVGRVDESERFRREEVRVIGVGRGRQSFRYGFRENSELDYWDVAETEKNWVVFGDADGGVGGIGESRVAESSPGDGERFKRGSGGSSSGWRKGK